LESSILSNAGLRPARPGRLDPGAALAPALANADAVGILLGVSPRRRDCLRRHGHPHPARNGAVITLLAVTELTHRQTYKDVFAITVLKMLAVFVMIGVFYATGLT
jgi:hypothetical protein